MKGGEVIQTMPEWARFSQGDQRKCKKNMKSKPKISQWKSCSTNHLYFPPPNPMILKAFAELFATKMKPTKGKKKKKRARRGKEEGTRQRKR